MLATRKVPVVVTVHGGDVFALDQAPLRAAKRFAFGRADAVTVNSSATERAVLDLARPRRLERIPMGIEVDPEVDAGGGGPRAGRAPRLDDGPLVALVGRVVAEKGVFDLHRRRRPLCGPICPSVRAVVLGEGQDRAAAEARVG